MKFDLSVDSVRGTKDTSRDDGMRRNEQRKIDCGKAHFEGALGVNYRVVKGAAELLGN